MGGDILVGDKTHYCNGSILVEWLVAITILLSLIGIGLSSIVTIPSRHELNKNVSLK